MNQMPPRARPLRRVVLVGSCTLALAVATLVTGLALWLALLDPTAHRDEIAAWLSKGLGRQVTVHGGVHLAVYPWLGLHLGNLAVADADGVSPFANARAAVVQVRLGPLIRQGEVELDRIVLLEPVLYLRRDAQGRCNWDDLLALAGADPDSDRPDHPGAPAPAYAGQDMRWRGVSIVNGLLVFDDALQDQRLTLSGIHCITGEGTAFDLALQCEADSTRFGRGSLDLQGHCQVDVASGNITLDNATLAFQGQVLPGGRFGSAAVPVALRTGLAWQTDVSMLELLDAHFDLAGEQVAASVRFEGLGAPGLRVAGRLARSAVPGGSSSLFWETVDASAAFEWSPERLALHEVVLKSRHSALTGNVTLTLGNAPVLAMQLDAPRVNVDELAAAFVGGGGPAVAVEEALGALAKGAIPGLPPPFDALQVRGAVRIKELALGGRRIHGASLNATVDGGGLALRLTAEDACAGPVAGEGRLTPKGLTASVQAGPLQLARCPEFKGLLGGGLVHSGGLTLGLNATAAGTAPDAWLDAWELAATAAASNGASDWDRIRRWFDTSASPAATAPASGPQAGSFGTLHLQLKAAAGKRGKAGSPRTVQGEASLTAKGLRVEPSMPVDAVVRASGTMTLDPQTWAVNALSGMQLDTAASLPVGLAGNAATTASLKARGEWDVAKNRLVVSSYVLKAHGSQATGSLSARLGDAPVVQGQTSIAPIALGSLWPALGMSPPHPKDPSAFARAELSADWKLEGKRLSLSSLKARLDETTVGGDLSFAMGPAGPTAWRFHLQADRLDLDRYLSTEPSGPTKPWDGRFLQSLQGKGSLYCGSFKLYDLRLSDAALTVEGLPGQMRIEPFTAGLAGGRMQVSLALLADKRRPGVELQVGADLMDFELNTVAEALGVGERLGGKTTFRFRLGSHGVSRQEHLQRLAGTASIQVANGFYGYYRTIKQETPTSADQLIKRPQPPQPPQPRRRELAVLNIITAAGTMQFDQGVVRNSDFRMASDQFTATGGGWLDFPSETMDYTLQIYPGLFPSFPVFIRGPVEDPDVDDSQGGSLAAAVGELTGTVFRTVLDVLVLPLRTLETIKP